MFSYAVLYPGADRVRHVAADGADQAVHVHHVLMQPAFRGEVSRTLAAGITDLDVWIRLLCRRCRLPVFR